MLNTPPLFLRAIFWTSAEVKVFFVRQASPIVNVSGTPLTIMTSSLGVGTSPMSNNKQYPTTTCTGHFAICFEVA
ncbi:hypothetical protein TNCV_2561121 [Trichonephila clavipes]|uniref:Uncharacterized protein n=1 Tax=Trichonephila clavipes TaxID=2585209 RepID=A0A8X6R2A2_TRICX|nr:hypothetical protein TNCV_2561121 [Trichonephila clavipes]